MKNIELISIRKADRNTPAGYMVKLGGKVIGFLDKYNNTKSETHPWKAFGAKKVGDNYQYDTAGLFKCFYKADGGKTAAIEFLVKATA